MILEDRIMFDDTRIEDSHMALLHSETFVGESDAAWYRWISDAERIAGHSLDGDMATGEDAYSLDAAYAAWEQGLTAGAYVRSFREA